MAEPIYNVQCLNGHVYMALAGTELEARCKEHEARGFLDALCLSPDECEMCKDENRRREGLASLYDMDIDPDDVVPIPR